MMYAVRVDGREVPVEILEDGDRVRLSVGGRVVEADLRPLGSDGAWSLRVGQRSHRLFVGPAEGEGRSVTLGSRVFRTVVEDEREAAAHAVRPPEAGGPLVVRSAMPGIVREVLVAEGAEVGQRAPLLVLEAMKMQNEVRADRAGRVARVHVAPGTTVAKGDPLVTLE